ncbi:hypothetical protein F5Y07DRAFT_402054 [Xylaria sp. FL0933]|nr:hypothetical protein F5Y07DRAFT_402054 [Xylaria sp. FL0933]
MQPGPGMGKLRPETGLICGFLPLDQASVSRLECFLLGNGKFNGFDCCLIKGSSRALPTCCFLLEKGRGPGYGNDISLPSRSTAATPKLHIISLLPKYHKYETSSTSNPTHPHYIFRTHHTTPFKMCDYEEFLFVCGHSVTRLKSHCHFARNDPNHQCFSVKVLKCSWYQQSTLCENCLRAGMRIFRGDVLHVQQIEQIIQAEQQMQG